MSESRSTTQPAAAAKLDSTGHVNIRLDAPVGTIITQPIDNQASKIQPHVQQHLPTSSLATIGQDNRTDIDLQPNTKDRQNSAVASAPSSDVIQPPELIEALEATQVVQSKQQIAKQKAQEAIKQVKELEQKATSLKEGLQQEVQDTHEKLADAQKHIQAVEEKDKESQKIVKELKEKSSDERIAGFKPVELVKALGKPPKPEFAPQSHLKIDAEEQAKLGKKAHAVHQEVEQTKDHIEKVEKAQKEIDEIGKTTQKPSAQNSSIVEKVSSVAKSISAPNTELKHTPYRAFLLLGALFVALALLTLVLTQSLLWVVLAVVAIAQLAYGEKLKNQS